MQSTRQPVQLLPAPCDFNSERSADEKPGYDDQRTIERFSSVVQGLSEGDDSRHMTESSQDVRYKVEEVLVHLQFQDRMSQFGAVLDDIERLLVLTALNEARASSGNAQKYRHAGVAKELERTLHPTLE